LGQTSHYQVISSLLTSQIKPIVVVLADPELVEQALHGYPVLFSHNPDYASSEMLCSLQVGIRAISGEVQALLVVLGDQPFLDPATIQKIVDQFKRTRSKIIVPSYQMRKGHPWLVEQGLWIT
jgi:molybdenum cofactor cytidylyltransferase